MGKDGVTVVSMAVGAGFFKKGADGLKDGIEDTGEKLIKKEGSFLVKDIVNKKIIKTIKKWDSKLGQLVEYPMYNNVALGKDLNGTLEAFGKEVGANVWTNKTDNIFTTMYDLMESRSFESNITEVLNKTITQNEGKILFDISNVNIQKAIDGGLIHNTTLVVDERLFTELELQMLLRNENWLNNTIFHNNGKVLSNEEMLNAGIKIIK
ncbi:hypothetical protein [Chryseobacterium bernardetii]|uniref:hypothetical protein n=1 Tax=Chryseobacterium bernardetii TaxID=1241978 RepID=UPI003016B929